MSEGTSIRVVRYEPVRVVTALAVMYFTLLRIVAGSVGALARTVGALSRNFCGMVGVSNVVAVRVSALAGRIGALSRNFCGMVGASNVVAVIVGAQAGAISVVWGLV